MSIMRMVHADHVSRVRNAHFCRRGITVLKVGAGGRWAGFADINDLRVDPRSLPEFSLPFREFDSSTRFGISTAVKCLAVGVRRVRRTLAAMAGFALISRNVD